MAMKSCSVDAPIEGCVASTNGTEPTLATGAKSPSASYGSFS
jgi:hypothetical protein